MGGRTRRYTEPGGIVDAILAAKEPGDVPALFRELKNFRNHRNFEMDVRRLEKQAVGRFLAPLAVEGYPVTEPALLHYNPDARTLAQDYLDRTGRELAGLAAATGLIGTFKASRHACNQTAEITRIQILAMTMSGIQDIRGAEAPLAVKTFTTIFPEHVGTGRMGDGLVLARALLAAQRTTFENAAPQPRAAAPARGTPIFGFRGFQGT